MSTDTAILAGQTYRQTEFVQGVLDPVTGQTVNLTGACGVAALAEVASWSAQKLVTVASVYQTMRRAGLCDISGVTTIEKLHAAAKLLKLPIGAIMDVTEPWPDWHTWATAQLAQGRSLLFEFGEAWRLVDSISGLGENANTNPNDPKHLLFHFASAFGYEPQGKLWIVCDPANLAGGNYRSNGFQAANVVQHYTDSVMASAQPCAALSIAKGAKIVTTTGAGAGFDAYAAANDITARLDAYIPLDNDHAAAVYDDGTVLWWASGQDVSAAHAGTALLAVNAKRVADEAEIANLRQQLATAQAALAKAESDLAAAKANTPAPAADPAPDPVTAKALELVAAIKAAVAA